MRDEVQLFLRPWSGGGRGGCLPTSGVSLAAAALNFPFFPSFHWPPSLQGFRPSYWSAPQERMHLPLLLHPCIFSSQAGGQQLSAWLPASPRGELDLLFLRMAFVQPITLRPLVPFSRFHPLSPAIPTLHSRCLRSKDGSARSLCSFFYMKVNDICGLSISSAC